MRLSFLSPIPAYSLANVALTTVKPIAGFDITLSGFNIFNRRFYDPAAAFIQDKIEQNGRLWRLKLVYSF